MSKKRFIILLLGILICLTLLLSYVFIIVESNHECMGNHCDICSELQICQSLIKNILPAGAMIVLVVYSIMLSINFCIRNVAIFKTDTLVDLKVLLLN